MPWPIDPIEKEIDGKIYILAKFPAVAGREIITQYPITAAPKVGDYKTNEALMLKLMAFVAVKGLEDKPLRLTTVDLIDNHVPNMETLMKIEWAMMEHNCSFFGQGKVFDFLGLVQGKLGAFLTQMLTDFSQQLLKKD